MPPKDMDIRILLPKIKVPPRNKDVSCPSVSSRRTLTEYSVLHVCIVDIGSAPAAATLAVTSAMCVC